MGSPIEHVIVCCQENHSFDSYFGSYPGLPAGYGIPVGFTQPDGKGGAVAPFRCWQAPCCAPATSAAPSQRAAPTG